MPGEEGSTEFMAEYYKRLQTLSTVTKPETDTLLDLTAYYKTTTDFTGLGKKSQKDYERYLKKIDAEFGDMPIQLINERPDEARGQFMEWRDTLSGKKRSADLAWSVLARVMSVCKHRSKIRSNPCEKGGRLYEGGDRTEKLWRVDHINRLFAVASKAVSDAVILGLFTGLREGKCVALSKNAYRDGYLFVPRFKRSKNHTPIRIPVKEGTLLKEMLDGIDWTSEVTTMLTNTFGRPWTEDGFRTSFGKACKLAKIGEAFGEENDLHFHDLRGTAATMLKLSGCEDAEIASVTEHSLKTVQEILEKHYLGDRAMLAERAIETLYENNHRLLFVNRAQKTVNQPPGEQSETG
jgi:integrase